MAPNKLRPGVEAAINLWKSDDPDKWEEALNSYEDCCTAIQKSMKSAQSKLSKTLFSEDKKWIEETLPDMIKSNRTITLHQLDRIMVWKLRRGQFRPTLMGLIKRNSAPSVEENSQKAISIIKTSHKNIPEAFKCLEKLHGVGPATASLILSIVAPEHVPFMSDEAMDASIGLPRSYTAGRFEKFQKALLSKSKKLGNGWHVGMIEKSLFATAVLSR